MTTLCINGIIAFDSENPHFVQLSDFADEESGPEALRDFPSNSNIILYYIAQKHYCQHFTEEERGGQDNEFDWPRAVLSR